MGQTFSEPVTEKESSSENNDIFLVASSSIQGWRISMEDAHTILLSMPDDPSASFFAVFDGHGGAKVANYASEHLHKNLCAHQLYQEGKYEEALKSAFVEFDEMMFNDEKMRDELAGSTAVVLLIREGRIYCANIGDSRAVAAFAGRVDPLSYDHKPTCPTESRRIVSAGGWVQFNRVNGNLALSRAFGDFVFKRNEKRSAIEQIVIAYPDVQTRPLTTELEFVVMACDGVWDVMTNEEVVEFIRRRIHTRMEPVAICEELITRCLAPDCQMGSGIGCDNMTVILICYLNGATYEEFCQRVASVGPMVMPSSSSSGGDTKTHGGHGGNGSVHTAAVAANNCIPSDTHKASGDKVEKVKKMTKKVTLVTETVNGSTTKFAEPSSTTVSTTKQETTSTVTAEDNSDNSSDTSSACSIEEHITGPQKATTVEVKVSSSSQQQQQQHNTNNDIRQTTATAAVPTTTTTVDAAIVSVNSSSSNKLPTAIVVFDSPPSKTKIMVSHTSIGTSTEDLAISDSSCNNNSVNTTEQKICDPCDASQQQQQKEPVIVGSSIISQSSVTNTTASSTSCKLSSSSTKATTTTLGDDDDEAENKKKKTNT